MSKASVICIGAAVQDVFLQDDLFASHHEKNGEFQELAQGSKNNIENITFSTGGGASNAAVTFARHGLTSYFMGRIGSDVAGKAVMEELTHEGVETDLIGFSPKYLTGYSAVLLAPNGERTILTYRGASAHFDFEEKDFKGHKPDWFYISSLSGDMQALKAVMDYAAKHDIKVAINPGGGELEEAQKLKVLLPHVTILSVNKEEAQKLFRGDTTEELIKHATQHVPIVIITDGPNGSMASDGHKLYTAGMYQDVKVVDRLGAGDAFSSGFVAVLIDGGTIERAITFASANSTSVVQQIGAKAGILHSHHRLHDMLIKVTQLG